MEMSRSGHEGKQRVDLRHEVASSVISASRNQRQRVWCPPRLCGRRHAQERPKVDQVLWTTDVIARENLESDQMARPGDAHREARQQLNRLGVGHDLGL